MGLVDCRGAKRLSSVIVNCNDTDSRLGDWCGGSFGHRCACIDRTHRTVLRLEEIPPSDLSRALDSGSFRLRIGNIDLRIESPLPELARSFRCLYARYPASTNGGEYDFDLAVTPASPLRQWIRRNAAFRISGHAPFLPMAADHAHALFEWGLNWTIGSHLHRYLILHSAVVEKCGKGVLLAAISGSGKSTLAAELALQGWRLFSDELALIDGPDLQLVPHPRPISLKNQSIDVIRRRHPNAIFGPVAKDTHKGTIAHLSAPDDAIDRAVETVRPNYIVFPKWAAGTPLRVAPIAPGQTAMRLIDQSFNYPILGRPGFERLADLVQAAEAWEIEYSSLDEMNDALDELITGNA